MKQRHIIISALLLMGAGAFAQQPDAAASQQNTDAAQQNVTIDQLKKLVTPSGFLQTGYTYTDAHTSTFLLRRARLVLQGDLYKGDAGKVDYKLQLELTGTPKILDLFVRYKPIDEFGVRLGQYKSPLSIENSEYNPAKLEFVEYSLVVKRLARMSGSDLSGYNQNGRDLGLEFLGSAFRKEGYSLLNYELAIFNGHTLNANDNNESKDIVGRLIVNLTKELSVAGYYQWGEGTYPQYVDSTHTFVKTNDLYDPLQRFGGGIAYKTSKAFARAEYIAGETNGTKSGGFYVAGGYEVVKNLALVARYDYFCDNNDDKDYNTEQDITVGVNYTPAKPINLKLNYIHQGYSKEGKDDVNGLYFMVTVKY